MNKSLKNLNAKRVKTWEAYVKSWGEYKTYDSIKDAKRADRAFNDYIEASDSYNNELANQSGKQWFEQRF